ncbi:TraR/DksA C4-type zinc finger protein [Gallaecimonas sp. GXIMD4217]|uniref:TraR/DksA family transcriptional regulator n=1 Tax=Gallaecimonas sp. GXIMD4217 TaxID=3131927 RepID=UPI00311ABAA0
MTDWAKLLDELEVELNEELEGLRQAASVVTLDQQALGRISRNEALQQQAMAKANLLQVERRLGQLKAARQRLADGDYGYCLDCGQAIEEARLRVRPESPYCLNCQGRRESA